MTDKFLLKNNAYRCNIHTRLDQATHLAATLRAANVGSWCD